MKFITMLKELILNIPTFQTLEQMPKYTKFLKELVMKKGVVIFEYIGGLHHCSVIMMRSLAEKRKDPKAFTIPCNIGPFKFKQALCDLGANINLILLVVYKQLGLGALKPTYMRLLIVDRTVKRQVSTLLDVLVKVESFIFPTNFILPDCEVDFQVPISQDDYSSL